MPKSSRSKRLVLTLRVATPAAAPLGEIGLFLYDLSTLYDLIRLGLDAKYKDFRFGKYPLFRGRRPLKPNDQLEVDGITLGPALEIRCSLAATSRAVAPVIMVLIEGLESVYGIRADPLEIERALRQIGFQPPLMRRAEARLTARGAEKHLGTVARRLRQSPLQLQTIGCSVE